MDFKVIRVPLDRVDLDDNTYRISTHTETEDLALSISAIGLLQLPAVIEVTGRLVVVYGFRRLAALGTIDAFREGVPLRGLSTDIPPAQLAVMAVSDNTFQRSLNVVEQSRGYGLLRRFCESPDGWIQAARMCGLPDSKKAMQRIASVIDMPDSLQQALVEGSIALPVAKQIQRMPESDGRIMTELLRQITTGLNIQRELVDLLTDISRRDAVPIERILDQERVPNLLEDEQGSMPQRVQRLRNLLKVKRYPTLLRVEEEYRQAVKRLCLSPQVQVQAPPYFEGKRYQVTLTVESRRQLRAIQKDIDKLAADEIILPE